MGLRMPKIQDVLHHTGRPFVALDRPKGVRPALQRERSAMSDEKCTCPKDEIPWHNNPDCPVLKEESSFAAPTGLGGIVELRDGWKLENGMPNNCSRIVRPDGKTAFYRYMQTTEDEAVLIAWAYQEGHKHGAQEREQRIKDVLGIEAT